METEPRPVAGGPPRLVEAVFEQLIPRKHRKDWVGDLAQSYVSLPLYIWKASEAVACGVIFNLGRWVRMSPVFELNRMGLSIAVAGFLAGMSRPSDKSAEDYGYLFGFLTGCIAIYFARRSFESLDSQSSGPHLAEGLILTILLTVQVCIGLFNALPGRTMLPRPDIWTLTITMMAVPVVMYRDSEFFEAGDDRE